MNVSLPSPLEDFVRRQVAGGEFQTPDEVVCEALRLLQRQEDWKRNARQKIDKGWEENKAGLSLSPKEMEADLAARKADWKQRHQG